MPRRTTTRHEETVEYRYDDAVAGIAIVADDRDAMGEMINEVAQELAAMQKELALMVAAARKCANGFSWADVGACLDMTRQGAQQRFSDANEHWRAADVLEQERARKALGITTRRQRFEVRMEAGTLVSRHFTLSKAIDSFRKQGFGACIVRISPLGVETEVERTADPLSTFS